VEERSSEDVACLAPSWRFYSQQIAEADIHMW